MKKKFYSLIMGLSFGMGLLALSGTAQAQQETGSLAYYGVTEEDYRRNPHEWQVFMEYHLHREQCQNYQKPPSGYVMKGCQLHRVEAVAPAAGITTIETLTSIVPQAGPSATSYTVYFDFDRSNIRDSEMGTLNNAIRDIQGSNPTTVIVSGHADRSGSETYNQGLSERRAQTVVQELTAQGISSTAIQQHAYGEMQPAVPTEDGVRMQENRRVVIDFNR